MPTSMMEGFCWPVPLAPNSEWNALVPTAANREGDFGSFSGQLIDPTTNEPYPANVIPASELGAVFAWVTTGGFPWGSFTPFIIGPATGNTLTLTPFPAFALPSGTNDWKISSSCNGVAGRQFSSANFEFLVNTNPE
jgi:hypothetical protein